MLLFNVVFVLFAAPFGFWAFFALSAVFFRIIACNAKMQLFFLRN
jgi:hypothetical protein